MSTLSLPVLGDNPRANCRVVLAGLMSLYGGRCRAIYQHGLLGFLVDDITWASLPGNTVPDPANPGQTIVLPRPTLDPPPEPAGNAGNFAIKKWETANKNREKVIDELRVCHDDAVPVLTDADRQQLGHPDHGMLHVTDRAIYAHISKHHGTLDSTDIETLLSDLTVQMSSSDTFSIIVGRHIAIYAKLEAAKVVTSEYMKCRNIRTVTEHIPHIKKAIEGYLAEHPAIADQNFAGLTKYVQDQAPNFITTTGTMGYANAAIASTNPDMGEMLMLLKELLKAQQGSQPTRPTGKRYCFFHKHNDSHDSTRCRYMKENPTLFTDQDRAVTQPPAPAAHNKKQKN